MSYSIHIPWLYILLCISGSSLFHFFFLQMDYYYYYYYYNTPCDFFSYFTGGWVTTSLFSSLGFFLNILSNLNNAIVWMASIHPLINHSFSLLSNPLETVLNLPFTAKINVTFMLHNFLSSLARCKYLPLFSFLSLSMWTAKSSLRQYLFFLLVITRVFL